MISKPKLGGDVLIHVVSNIQQDELSLRVSGNTDDIAIIIAAMARNNPQFHRALVLAKTIINL